MKPILSIIVIAMLAFQIFSATAQELPIKLDWVEFRDGAYKTGNLILSGQPLSEESFDKLTAEGVTTIINLRTPLEMADKESTPIDEITLAENHGIRYIQLPSGDSTHPMSSDTVKKFAEIYASTQGQVLLHCNSGRRATHLWVAFLVDHRGMTLKDAVSLGKGANFGRQPLEDYLAGELQYQVNVP